MEDIQKFKEPFFNFADSIKVEFSKSPSANFKLALDLIKNLPTYSFENGLHSACFFTGNFSELESLMQLLKLVKNWNSTRIYINNIASNLDFFNSVISCYAMRMESRSGDGYCAGWGNHVFKCFRIRVWEIEQQHWEMGRYGFFNEKGIWFFNKSEIIKEILQKIHPVRICPALDIDSIRKFYFSLPDSIDPKNNQEWDYLYDRPGSLTLTFVLTLSGSKKSPEKKHPIGVKKLSKIDDKKEDVIPIFDEKNSVKTPGKITKLIKSFFK